MKLLPDVLLSTRRTILQHKTPVENEVQENKTKLEELDDLETPPSEIYVWLIQPFRWAARSASQAPYEFDETYDWPLQLTSSRICGGPALPLWFNLSRERRRLLGYKGSTWWKCNAQL
jgi:hypothetical protein